MLKFVKGIKIAASSTLAGAIVASLAAALGLYLAAAHPSIHTAICGVSL